MSKESKDTAVDKLKKELQEKINMMNPILRKMGLFELVVVDPRNCIGQDKNARYFDISKFKQLVSNIQKDGALESVPLLYGSEELDKIGKYEIISGHHRIEAAAEAGIKYIIAFVRRDITRDELVSKQLSHNALVGKDDQAILKELFDSIHDIDLKMATGLQDEIAKVSYESLNFRVGTFKTLILAFSPADLESYDEIAERFVEEIAITDDTEIRVASMDDYDNFIKAIQKVKKIENIKNNSVAIHRLATLASIKLEEMEQEAKELEESND